MMSVTDVDSLPHAVVVSEPDPRGSGSETNAGVICKGCGLQD